MAGCMSSGRAADRLVSAIGTTGTARDTAGERMRDLAGEGGSGRGNDHSAEILAGQHDGAAGASTRDPSARTAEGSRRCSVYCGRLTVSRELQSRGYASEMAELSNRFRFTVLKAHRVRGVVHEDNAAARQALLNTGMPDYKG